MLSSLIDICKILSFLERGKAATTIKPKANTK